MGAHPETRYHVHGQTEPDDAGKRSAVKAARYVWRGAFGKVPAMATRRVPTLPEKWSDRAAGGGL